MAHASPATTGHRAVSAHWAGPVLLGIVYGVWAAGIRRDAGPITTGNVLFGVVAGLVFAAAFFGLHRVAHTLPREVRALSWTAFAGIAFGFLYSLTDASVLRSVIMSLLVAGAVFVVTFYRYYTTE
ncbi:hypothetical protein [Streptomyces formicae]|uniref:Putative integral membrane protein n=1 Tax=Streptomyces formicae TaxID=1616117 RepID=A0A291QCK6_9ACTN|nr:hypothetical protein [Streptomyces formicae]ATL29193.1 putative integral membrane protein [Streptomyces formicae]